MLIILPVSHSGQSVPKQIQIRTSSYSTFKRHRACTTSSLCPAISWEFPIIQGLSTLKSQMPLSGRTSNMFIQPLFPFLVFFLFFSSCLHTHLGFCEQFEQQRVKMTPSFWLSRKIIGYDAESRLSDEFIRGGTRYVFDVPCTCSPYEFASKGIPRDS